MHDSSQQTLTGLASHERTMLASQSGLTAGFELVIMQAVAVQQDALLGSMEGVQVSLHDMTVLSLGCF